MRAGPVPSILLALALAGCAAPADVVEGESAAMVTPLPTSIEIAAGNASGALALRVHLRVVEPSTCSFGYNATGLSPEGASVAVHAYGEGDTMASFTIRSVQSTLGAQAHAHAEDAEQVVDTKGPTRWFTGASSDFEALAENDAWVLFLMTDLASVEDEEGHFADRAREDIGNDTARMRISCEHAFEVAGLEGSRNARVFTEETLRGGVGATVTGVDPTGVAIASSASLEVNEPVGWVGLEVRGDLLLNHVSAGKIDVTTPSETRSYLDHPSEWIVHGAAGLPHITGAFQDGPGSYRVDATWASVDLMGVLHGFLCGLAPVESAEALFAA